MIYLRLRGKAEDIMAQVAFAEKLSKLYNQEIALYTNGSYDNNKEYYDSTLVECGLFNKYQFVDTYPITEPVLFEDSPNFNEQIAQRGQNGQDIVIEGDFYYRFDVDYHDLKNGFQPSAELLEYMQNYGITNNSLYIEAFPFLENEKDEFALAGRLLEEQISHFENKNFDKVFVLTEYVDFFMTAEFEEILGVQNITYVNLNTVPLQYRDSIRLMFPYLCGSSLISNYKISWWGHVLNQSERHQIGILFPYGEIKRVENAPDGISTEVIVDALKNFYHFKAEELKYLREGEPSAYDNIFFDSEVGEDSGHTKTTTSELIEKINGTWKKK